MASGSNTLSPRMVMTATFGVTSALNYGFGFAMGWLLPPGDYGLLAFAQTILLVGGLVLHSGFSWSLARAVVRTDDTRERDAAVRGAFAANFLLAAAIGLVLVVLFAAGPLRGGFEHWSVAIIVAACLPLLSMVATARGCAQGSERFGIVASLGLTEVSFKALGGGALALMGFGAAGATAGFLGGSVCAAALGVRRLVRGIGVRMRGNLKPPDILASGAMFGALLGISLLLSLDLGALKLLSDERATTGFYQAGIVLANAPYYLVTAAVLPVLFVQLARHESIPDTRATLGETLGLTAALVLPFEIALMAVPEQALLALFPDAYAEGAQALRLLAVGNALLIPAAVISAAFQAVGRARLPASILMTLVALEPFALWWAVPAYGARGAAWTFLVAAAIALALLSAAYVREAGAVCLKEAAPWAARYTLAVGAGFAAGGAVSGLGLGVYFAAIAGGACYVVAAVALRLFDPLAMLPGGSPRALFRMAAASRKG